MSQHDLARRIAAFAQRSPLANSEQDVIDDIVQWSFDAMVLAPLFQRVFPCGSIWAKPEQLGGLEKYCGHPPALWEELAGLVDAFHHLLDVSAPFSDVLGDLYTQSLAPRHAQGAGQFLTPPALAHATLAFMPLREPRADAPLSLGDLTGCGSGALALASLHRLNATYGDRCLQHVHVFLNDMDPRMAKLAAVQIGLSAMFHRIELGSVAVHCADVIADYLKTGTMILAMRMSEPCEAQCA